MSNQNQCSNNSLKAIGETYSSKPPYEAFGAYCLLEDHGMKMQAAAAMNDFARTLDQLSVSKQREIASDLCLLAYGNPNIHQLLPQLLSEQLQAIVATWSEDETDNAVPYRWRGFFTGDAKYYRRAPDLDMQDQFSILGLANCLLQDVEFQTHSLPDSSFIGDLEEAKDSLDEAQMITSRLFDENMKNSILGSIEHFNYFITLWEEYKNSNTKEPFPQWCKSTGRDCELGSPIYF